MRVECLHIGVDTKSLFCFREQKNSVFREAKTKKNFVFSRPSPSKKSTLFNYREIQKSVAEVSHFVLFLAREGYWAVGK